MSNNKISPDVFISLKARIKKEVQRRCHVGSVSSYGDASYDYTEAPKTGVPVATEYFNKILTPLRAINPAELPIEKRNGDFITDTTILDAKITIAESKTVTAAAANTGCSASCTGLCSTSCTNCTGCTGTCSSCTGTCTGSCSGCTSCTGTCTGCSGCSGGCQGCGGSCSYDCSDACTSTCSYGCGTCGGDCGAGCGTECTINEICTSI